ncbi:MAG: hypothetical protein IAE92_13755 [Burkholderiaceae bacterium]|nr:hypothetical protein [Burkholderiaceae bacterium]
MNARTLARGGALRPVALAIALLHGLALAQPAANTTSADVLDANSPFETGGQQAIGPRPFTSFLDRLSSPVSKISLKVAGDNLAADGLSGTNVAVQLLDEKGAPVAGDVDVTIEVDNGARVALEPTPAAQVDARGVNNVQPGTRTLVKGGQFSFQVLAPYQPAVVTVRVTVKGVVEKAVIRYVPELREMLAVGLIEAGVRANKFDPRQIVQVAEDDGFDKELTNLTRDFNGGKSAVGARVAMYLKGKIKGDYLLTMALDTAKENRNVLFREIDPNAFYPIYGDSSVTGVDAQSSGKLYVRVDNKLSYLLYGDYATQDSNPARLLSQYSRSLTGLMGHYEEGNVIADGFVSQQKFRQIVDEFPARGVSGPYAVSNPTGVSGSEKIEILVRDRNQTGLILKSTTLTRYTDYEFEPFSGRILFKSPIPSIDDQLNPITIRVTYEVEQGGDNFLVYGGDARVRLNPSLILGVGGARDENPLSNYQVAGATMQYLVGKNAELQVEVAGTRSTINSGSSSFNASTSNIFAGRTGEISGNAARIEYRQSDERMRLRAYAVKADEGFNNPLAGITGGRTEGGVAGAYKIDPRWTVSGEYIQSKDDILNTSKQAASIGVDLKLTDRLTIGAGFRSVHQDVQTLASTSLSPCNLPSLSTSGGYNSGYGLGNQGNQQIDQATGQQVSCAPTQLTAASAGQNDIQINSAFVRAAYQVTPSVNLTGYLQGESGSSTSLLYGVGADWNVADKTRVYARYDYIHPWGGAYGLGYGAPTGNFALGIDTQYMQDGSLYSEYRLRDASAGREVQAAIGLRNGWMVGNGLRLLTNVESVKGVAGNSYAAGAGLEYTASELWKASGRLEWRQDPNNTNWLMTIAMARKLDRNWSWLLRDYASIVQPRNSLGLDNRQNRFQFGFAYRPVDNNQLDALGLYEYKSNDDRISQLDYNAHILSLRANWHPSRPWWVTGRYAYKRVEEQLISNVPTSYQAQLIGGRVTYDITNQWSIGALGGWLQGGNGARQYAYGLEVGYVIADNLLATVGYNWQGFKDPDLTGGEYYNQGWVAALRYKFDESLFKGSDPGVNKTLSPALSPTKP